jgi:hypothetical protein
MKASSPMADSPPRGHLPLPAERRTPNAERTSTQGTPPLQSPPDRTRSCPLPEDGDFREYYRLR